MSTKITRRYLLCRAAPALATIPIGLALAGCPAFNKAISVVDSVTPKVIAEVGVIAQVAGIVLPAIQGLTGLGSAAGNIIGRAETVIADAQAVARDIGAVTGPGAVALVTRLGTGIRDLAPLLSGVRGVPPVVSSWLTNALALLPAIEQGVGIVSALAPAQHRFARAAAAISPEQAYQNLLAMAAGR